MAKLSINIPHQLTPEQARGRIAAAVEEYRTRTPFLGTINENWTNDRCDFIFSAFGAVVPGYLQIQPNNVHVEIDLPLPFAALASRIRGALENVGRKLLTR